MTIHRRVKVRLTGAALATQGNEQPAAVEGAVPREDTEMTTRIRFRITGKRGSVWGTVRTETDTAVTVVTPDGFYTVPVSAVLERKEVEE